MSRVFCFLGMIGFYVAGMFGGHYLLGLRGGWLAIFCFACAFLVLPAQLAVYAIADSAWGTQRHQDRMTNKSPKARWVVVQDLRPFGFRVEGRYRSKWRAQLKAGGSSYWEVRPLAYVESEHVRLSDIEEVMRDAVRYARYSSTRSRP